MNCARRTVWLKQADKQKTTSPVSSIGDAAWEVQMLGELQSLELDVVGVDGSEVVHAPAV